MGAAYEVLEALNEWGKPPAPIRDLSKMKVE
jgi:hypothetical protein